MTDLKWTKKTTIKISAELLSLGIKVGPKTVGRLLKKMGFSLKTNCKTIISGGKRKPGDRPKRHQPFLHIEKIKGEFEGSSQPLSASTQRKKRGLAILKTTEKPGPEQPPRFTIMILDRTQTAWRFLRGSTICKKIKGLSSLDHQRTCRLWPRTQLRSGGISRVETFTLAQKIF